MNNAAESVSHRTRVILSAPDQPCIGSRQLSEWGQKSSGKGLLSISSMRIVTLGVFDIGPRAYLLAVEPIWARMACVGIQPGLSMSHRRFGAAQVPSAPGSS